MTPDAPKHRVVRVIARLNVGGPAIHTVLLTHLLNPDRFASTLVTGRVSASEGDMSHLAAEYGVAPTIIPELGREIRWQNDLIVLWKLYRLMRQLRPTIVHTHTAKAGMLGRAAAKLAGVPIVVHTFHGHVFHSYFSRAKTRLFLGIERRLARLTDAIITLSSNQRREILAYGIGRPAAVRAIGLGLDLRQFVEQTGPNGALRHELDLAPETPLIGIVGRLVPVKGHRFFLEAAQQVLTHIPAARFVIIGDGELRPHLEQQAAALQIGDRVHFLGFRPNSPDLYADLNLVVLSSLNEGLPVTLIEAMASGKPVVATRVGGVPDLVRDGEAGAIAPPQNSPALAEAIVQMLQRPAADRAALGAAGRRSVYPRYHISTLVDNIAALYDELIAQKLPHKKPHR
jgi:glycosyltransferase involved in cell wall biosynthesis